MLSNHAETRHVGKMPIYLLAQVYIIYQVVFNVFTQVIQPNRLYARFCSFQYVLQNAIVFRTTVQHTDCLAGLLQCPLELLTVTHSPHRNHLVQGYPSIKLYRLVDKRPDQFRSQAITDNVYKLVREHLVYNICQNLPCLD